MWNSVRKIRHLASGADWRIRCNYDCYYLPVKRLTKSEVTRCNTRSKVDEIGGVLFVVHWERSRENDDVKTPASDVTAGCSAPVTCCCCWCCCHDPACPAPRRHADHKTNLSPASTTGGARNWQISIRPHAADLRLTTRSTEKLNKKLVAWYATGYSVANTA